MDRNQVAEQRLQDPINASVGALLKALDREAWPDLQRRPVACYFREMIVHWLPRLMDSTLSDEQLETITPDDAIAIALLLSRDMFRHNSRLIRPDTPDSRWVEELFLKVLDDLKLPVSRLLDDGKPYELDDMENCGWAKMLGGPFGIPSEVLFTCHSTCVTDAREEPGGRGVDSESLHPASGPSHPIVLSHNHLPFEEAVSPETAEQIRSLLINNEAQAHEVIRFATEPIDSLQIYPVVALARFKSLQSPARRIEISPYWFCYSVNCEAATVTLICLACDTEFTMPATTIMNVTRSCPNCSFSQSVFRTIAPEADEMLAYLRAAARARQSSVEWEREFVRGIRQCRANGFAPSTLANLPRDRFLGRLKQLDLISTPPEFRQIFQSYFGQFSQPSYPAHLDAMPGAEGVKHIFLGTNYLKKSTGRYRRFSGGPDLGPGRYFAVCLDDSGNDNSTMTAELLSYSTPEAGGFPALYDSTVLGMPVAVVELFSNGILASVGPPFDPQKPALIALVSDRPLTGDIIADAKGAVCVTACNLKVGNHDIENVLDLRLARSQVFLAAAVSQLQEVGESEENDGVHGVVNMPLSDDRTGDNEGAGDFMDLLSTITAPLKGGGEFHDAVGKLLRVLGYSGLVFPSARRDCGLVDDMDGNMQFDGWNFVDYRNAGSELSDDIFRMLGMRGGGGGMIAPWKVYGACFDGKYTFARGFHIQGAEERDARHSQTRRAT